ncbi:hypothetical protein [Streptomyces carpinensis]|uniref:Uncharacterized protein n=1 Tax=Streptomyces carpinensis TaxID=66369 RepID=A0ABV1VY97_9ACTN|nr:hypothetical protein [Streptomyces carpinensis]
MPTRTFVVAAAGVGAALLTATGITYAATTGSAPDSKPAHRAAAPAHRAAAPAQKAAQPAQKAAQPAQKTAPDTAPSGRGDSGGEKNEGRDREGGGRGHDHEEKGWIYFNERAYSASAEGCISAASGLGSNSFNIFNDSRKTVEVFRGFTCDGGAPVATVSPHGATNGVVTSTTQEGMFGNGIPGAFFGDDGVVGSFRVIGDRDEW